MNGISVAVVADTHVPRRAKKLPDALLRRVEGSDVILHAGDLMDRSVLDELEDLAPTLAVRGNLDPPDSDLPESLDFELGGVKISMVHDSGPKRGRRSRMKRRFPDSRVVVFGHSHIPFLEDDGELLLLNPGSPTDKRREPEFTFALLRIQNGEVEAEIVPLIVESA